MSCSSNGGNFIVPQRLARRDLFAFDLDEFIGDWVVELDGLLFDVFVEVGFVSQFRSLAPGRADHVFERVVFVGRYAESMVPFIIWDVLVLWLIAVFHDDRSADEIHDDILALVDLFGVAHLFRA